MYSFRGPFEKLAIKAHTDPIKDNGDLAKHKQFGSSDTREILTELNGFWDDISPFGYTDFHIGAQTSV